MNLHSAGVLMAWAAAAIEQADLQGYFPNSPSERVEDRTALCAAACIAYAGLKVTAPVLAEIFMDEVGVMQDKRIVVDAFMSFGLSEEVCFATMALNDASAPAERIDNFRTVLSAYVCSLSTPTTGTDS